MIHKKLRKMAWGGSPIQGLGFQPLNNSTRDKFGLNVKPVPQTALVNNSGGGNGYGKFINNNQTLGNISAVASSVRNGLPRENMSDSEPFAESMTNTAQGAVSAINPAIGALYAVGSTAGKMVRGDGTGAGGQIASGVINPSHSGFTAVSKLKSGDINFGEALIMQDPIMGGILKSRLAKKEKEEREERERIERKFRNKNNAADFYANNPSYIQGNTTSYYAKGGSLREKLSGSIIGGELKPIGTGALEVKGNSHKKGGVKLPDIGVEVEGGETIDLDLNGDTYVFSKELGFADKHKKIAKSIAKIESKPKDRTTEKSIQLLKRKGEGLKQQQELVKSVLDIDNDDNKLPEGGSLSDFGTALWEDAKQVGSALKRKGQELLADEYTGTFNSAFEQAKRNGDQIFIWNGKAYNTKSDLSPQQQIDKYGITDSQAEGRGLLSDRLYKTIKPSTYTDPKEVVSKAKDFIKGTNRFTKTEEVNSVDDWGGLNGNAGYDDTGSEDGWRMYLGLPQKNNTFGISNTRPSRSSDPNATYYRMNDDFERQLLDSRNYYDTEEYSEGIMGNPARVLGNFQVQEGKDDKGNYISYYDRYDLDPNVPGIGNVKAEGIAGKPFEVYNRIYYDVDANGKKIMRRKPLTQLAKGGSLRKLAYGDGLISRPRTREEILAFQAANGLDQDGIFGPKSEAAFQRRNELDSYRPLASQGIVNNTLSLPDIEVRGTGNDYIAPSTRTRERGSLGDLVPYASNIFNSFRRLPDVPRPELNSRITPSRVNYDASRQEAKRQTRGLMGAIASSTSNQATVNANRAAALAGNIRAVNEINQAEQNANAQIENRTKIVNSSIERENNRLLDQYNANKVSKKITQQNLASENIANIIDKYQKQKRDKGLSDLENRRLNAILKIYEHSGILNRGGFDKLIADERRALKR